AGLEMAKLEHAIVGGTEWHRDRGCEFDIESGRHRPGIACRDRAQRGVRTKIENRRDFLPDSKVLDLGANFDDLAARLVTDDVRLCQQWPAPPVKRISPLDADGFNPNHYALGMTNRIGNIFVFEHLGRSVLVI